MRTEHVQDALVLPLPPLKCTCFVPFVRFACLLCRLRSSNVLVSQV